MFRCFQIRNFTKSAPVALLSFAVLLAIANQGMAATIPVAPNSNLAGITAVSGDIWALQGNASLYGGIPAYIKQLPGPLTINGAAGGSVVTMNDAGVNYASFRPQGAIALNVTLTDLTIAGSSAVSAFYNSTGSATTLSTSGVTFSGNNGANGGAIYSIGAVTLTGGETFTGNTAAPASGYGGAVFSNATLTFTDATQTLTVRNNSAPGTAPSTGGGGGLNAAGNILIPGSALFDQNTAGGSNGGAIRSVTGNVDVATANGSNVVVTGNRATALGIAGGGGFFAGAAASTITVGNVAGTVQIGGPLVTDRNSGLNGGGIYSVGNAVINGSAITIANNATIGGRGAGIYTVGNLTLNASGPATISDNIAVDTRGGGFYVGGNFTLNANSGDVTFTRNKEGSRANAVYLSNTGGGKTASLNASAGQVITFYDPIESLASSGRVNVTSPGAGLVSFDGSLVSSATDRWSQVYANTQVTAGTFEVANNARYGVQAIAVGQATDSFFVTAAGAQLQGGVAGTVDADQVTLSGTLNIAGSQPATRGRFTFNSKAVAFSGAQIQFNTELNDATVQNTDLLVINAVSTSGAGTVQVTNVGGLGAATVGNGIQIIQINGTTSNNATFTLASPVYAGIYQYVLVKVGNHWYLQSQVMPALQLTKTVSPTSFTAGGTVTYTITATNTSATTVISNVTVSDPLPSGIASFNWTCVGNGAVCPNASGSGALNQTIVALPASASVTYSVTAVVTASPPAQINNTASASASGMLCAPGNTLPPCTASAPLPAKPVIQVTKTANTSLLIPGSTVVYTITAANVGAVSASNVVIGDSVPAGVTSFTWACAGSGAVCPNASGSGAVNETVASLPVSSSVTYTVSAVISASPPAQVNNTATATTSGALCAPGNTSAPCSSSAPLPAAPVVQINKTVNTTTIPPGGSVVYTVTVANTSASAASNVLISDSLPTGVSSFAWTCVGNGAVCPNASGSGALNETIASLPASASVTYTVTAAVVASPPAQINNTASASASGMLCAPGNTASPCTSSAPLPSVPVVQVTKIADTALIVPGSTVRYTVTVANVGAITASNVVVGDLLPTGVSSFTWTCVGSGTTCPNASGSGAISETVVSLPVSSSVTYTVDAVVSASPPAQISNTATATAAGMLCAPGNTASPCSANVLLPTEPVVQISKTVNTTTIPPGGTVVYTVTVANTSASAASDVLVSDPLPTGVSSFDWTCVGSGAICPNASGSGALSETVVALPGGSSVVYTISAVISGNPPTQIQNVATALSGGGMLCSGGTAEPCSASALLLPVFAVVPVPMLKGWPVLVLIMVLLLFGIKKGGVLACRQGRCGDR